MNGSTSFWRFCRGGVLGKPEAIPLLRSFESDAGSRAAVASKESEDLNELKGVKILLSELLVEFSVLARFLSWRIQ